MTPRSIATLRRIERKYGTDVFTSGYCKLAHLSRLCSMAATDMGEEVHVLMEYVLE
jgi:hypothetical protein